MAYDNLKKTVSESVNWKDFDTKLKQDYLRYLCTYRWGNIKENKKSK